MSRVQPGITLPEELWKKAKNQYGSRKTSKKIEELIAKDLEENQYQQKQQVLNLSDLSEKRAKLVLKLFEKGSFPYTKSQIGGIARKEGIYTSSKYVKKAVKVLDKNSDMPLETTNGKVRATDIDCDCGAALSYKGLEKQDWTCPMCDRKFEIY
ncbi:hypothetical protein OSG_eHP23_00110 [environmental Halophage eHP-23]|nr:hypothetical protein OSG_eHP23_00110 [environmental Halophage eHP-23]